jgi:hypothetical protein
VSKPLVIAKRKKEFIDIKLYNMVDGEYKKYAEFSMMAYEPMPFQPFVGLMGQMEVSEDTSRRVYEWINEAAVMSNLKAIITT